MAVGSDVTRQHDDVKPGERYVTQAWRGVWGGCGAARSPTGLLSAILPPPLSARALASTANQSRGIFSLVLADASPEGSVATIRFRSIRSTCT